jgi:alpha-aminoadipate/glutamate carrier protein LysW
MKMAECPECGADVSADKVEQGEILNCQDCGVELEVTNVNPIMLQLAPKEEEDWGE